MKLVAPTWGRAEGDPGIGENAQKGSVHDSEPLFGGLQLAISTGVRQVPSQFWDRPRNSQSYPNPICACTPLFLIDRPQAEVLIQDVISKEASCAFQAAEHGCGLCVISLQGLGGHTEISAQGPPVSLLATRGVTERAVLGGGSVLKLHEAHLLRKGGFW